MFDDEKRWLSLIRHHAFLSFGMLSYHAFMSARVYCDNSQLSYEETVMHVSYLAQVPRTLHNVSHLRYQVLNHKEKETYPKSKIS